ncbi:protein Tma23p [[Candida] anglica]|uniref:Protein Tma23p n=1 Tax=[Candida] anglica TaxID=148631 RepID=A0ABP0EQW0_9ASCO
MDAKGYLQGYGWKEGEALQKGGLKKPILVKHKKDNKGLGGDGNDADMWWEKLFDGQLKSLEVTSGKKGVSFDQNKDQIKSEVAKANSPLYRMFIRGEGLAGTVGKTDHTKVEDKVDYKKAMAESERVLGKKDMKKKEKKEKKKMEKKERKKVEKQEKKEKKKLEKKLEKEKKKIEKKEMKKLAKEEKKLNKEIKSKTETETKTNTKTVTKSEKRKRTEKDTETSTNKKSHGVEEGKSKRRRTD